ncbi:ribulose-bisphosphate carboxylase large subunit [Candidatus Pacearchaeota archaeon]|nr:ribulose-bisphosphate carboxylase large subunit [Candidatus Pacearchaeota archaeon]|tara:strand:- start:1713 stop:3104 length:1392 start_codon:yes stop_codon:yes gene_type:complete
MAVQLDYIAKKGWKPTSNHLITLIKLELSKIAIKEAKGKPLKKVFEEGAASVAAESSTGTWTKVYDGPGSGIPRAAKYKALAFDLDFNNKMFKVAYPMDLFEPDNMSGLLAGIVGNIAGMKMVSGMRIFDVKFPKKMVKAFLGPKFGVEGVRKFLGKKKECLLCTVPKPKIGRTDKEQALLARDLFSAGDGSYDGIKDDENLTNLTFNPFYSRVKLVLDELKKAENKTGKKKFYLCDISHSNIDEMEKRARHIKKHKGTFMMIDVITTGFAAVDTIRRKDLGLAIHAHRAMHGFITRDNSEGIHGHGELEGFSISMIVLAKIFRLLGVDSIHGGSPLAKMEDYGEAEYIAKVLQEKNLKPDKRIPSLGQDWHHIKPVWMTASGGLHPGDFESVLSKLGNDIIIQCGGGVLGHPKGVKAGVIAAQQARSIFYKKIPIRRFVREEDCSELASAVEIWGYGPRIVY